MRSTRTGPAFCAGNPDNGVRTSGTTRASGGILGSESFRGPPQAEQDIAVGVFKSVHRGHAHPDTTPTSMLPTSPLGSDFFTKSSSTCCRLGSELEVMGSEMEGEEEEGVGPFEELGGAPQTEHAPDAL